MSVSTVLFDFGGTLDANGSTWLDRFYPLYLRQGLDLSREAFVRAFYDSDDNLPKRHDLGGLGLEETLRLQVQDVLTAIGPGLQGLVERIVQPFLYDSRDSFRRAKPVLERLGACYSLGIVSNFYGNLESILEGEGLLRYFAVVADSGKVGFTKPEPELFLHAMNRLKAGPSGTWMVGDSINRDMKGAELLGLRHAWLRGTRPDSMVCCVRAAVIDSLDDLEARLGSSALV